MTPVYFRITSIAFLLVPIICPAAEQPMAPWGIHTIVTTGSRFYEGKKTRAVLVYGETGGPIITIESIRVEMGYPTISEVLWQAKIEIIGDVEDPCPIAETYCAYIKDLRWSEGDLHYDLVAPSTTLRCQVEGIEMRGPKTTCEAV